MTGPAGRKLATVAPQPGSARPRMDPGGLAEADLLHRLALWLADVSAEAALREPDAQPEGQGEVVVLERTPGRRQR